MGAGGLHGEGEGGLLDGGEHLDGLAGVDGGGVVVEGVGGAGGVGPINNFGGAGQARGGGALLDVLLGGVAHAEVAEGAFAGDGLLDGGGGVEQAAGGGTAEPAGGGTAEPAGGGAGVGEARGFFSSCTRAVV